MNYYTTFDSLIGKLTISSDGKYITGIWIENQKHFGSILSNNSIENNTLEIFSETKKWLKEYFSGKNPQSKIPIKMIRSDFRKMVWNIIYDIPYGKIMTYGEIAKIISEKTNKPFSCSKAVGNAVGRNPILIVIPCHRVVGTRNKLTGFAGGIDIKEKLLKIENTNI